MLPKHAMSCSKNASGPSDSQLGRRRPLADQRKDHPTDIAFMKALFKGATLNNDAVVVMRRALGSLWTSPRATHIVATSNITDLWDYVKGNPGVSAAPIDPFGGPDSANRHDILPHAPFDLIMGAAHGYGAEAPNAEALAADRAFVKDMSINMTYFVIRFDESLVDDVDDVIDVPRDGPDAAKAAKAAPKPRPRKNKAAPASLKESSSDDGGDGAPAQRERKKRAAPEPSSDDGGDGAPAQRKKRVTPKKSRTTPYDHIIDRASEDEAAIAALRMLVSGARRTFKQIIADLEALEDHDVPYVLKSKTAATLVITNRRIVYGDMVRDGYLTKHQDDDPYTFSITDAGRAHRNAKYTSVSSGIE